MKRYDSTRSWYAVTTYAGYEDKVAESLRQRINGVDMADKIFDVMVPKEKQIEGLIELADGSDQFNTQIADIYANIKKYKKTDNSGLSLKSKDSIPIKE